MFGVDAGWDEIHRGAQIRIPAIFRWVMKYVAPLYLAVVLVAFCVTNLPASIRQISEQPLAQGALALIAAVLAVLVLCLRAGERRWRALGLDLDGREPLSASAAGGER